MGNEEIIKQLVKELKINEKFEIIRNIPETTLHYEIRELLSIMNPDSYIEVTHGADEFGKDLVMIKKEPMGVMVYAMVVKTGDISSRASKEIAVIKDQVNEAFAHPAVLNGFEASGNLEVNYVYVIIAGQLSGNAMIRLKAEINNPIKRTNLQILDMDWLVDNFTKYYPYVFYEGEVSLYIESTIKQLGKKHLFSTRGIDLTEYYVEPEIAKLERVIELSDTDITLTLLRDRMSFKQLEKEIQPGNKFLVVGDPGVGKTTALAKLGIDKMVEALKKATRAGEKGSIDIPIFVTAKELWELNSVEELLDKYGPNKQTRDKFKISVLLVDGLDEAKGDYREELLKKASQFAAELKSALIVSTRKIDLVKKETIGYEKRLLLPFEFGQALKILGRLAKDDRMLEELKEGLRNLADQMPLTALSLLFLVELVESNKEIPASLTELYDRFTNMALGIDDKNRKGINLLFDYKVKRRFLGELSYSEFFLKNQAEITRKEFDDFLSEYSKEYRMDDKVLKEFIDEIQRAGLLELGNKVRFTHKSILDFFIAIKIDDTREKIDNLYGLLTKIFYDDMWSEVTTFFAGLREVISVEMIREIMSYSDGDKDDEEELMRNVHKLLFGKMLQAAWHSKSDTKLFGIQNSISYSDKVVEKFLKLAREGNPMMPAIYADIYSLILCEMSFGSRFLLNEDKLTIEKYLEKPTGENVMRSLRILWSIKDKTPAEDRRELLDKLYSVIKKSNELTGEEYAKCLLMIRVIALKDQVIFKAIEKKLQHELKKNPQLFSSKLINLKKQSSYSGNIRPISTMKRKMK